MKTPEVLLRADGVCFAYDDADVIHDLDAAFSAGRVTAIVGSNGSGKSTLLELLAGSAAPRRGAIERRAPVALVVQRTAIIDTLPLSVGDVVAMGAWGRDAPRASRAERRAPAEEAMTRVGVSSLARRSIHEVSGGQRQRALVAQALVRVARGARVLLLDEPSAGLDAGSRETIRAILAEEAARGCAIGWATHDDEDVARADDVIRLG